MAIRGSLPSDMLNSDVAIKAVLDLEEFMKEVPKEALSTEFFEDLEKVAMHLDSGRCAEKTEETFFWMDLISETTGVEPKTVQDIVAVLKDIWSDILNIVVFRAAPKDPEYIRKFLLTLHDHLMRAHMHQVDEWRRWYSLVDVA